MSVGSWNPESQKQSLPNKQVLDRVLVASNQSIENNFGLSAEETEKYAQLMQLSLSSWHPLLSEVAPEDLIGLLKFFTLAEQHFDSWQAGARSPVIAIAKVLREKSAYPNDLTAWIRAHSDNRFLPHGSLMDRL